MKFQAIERKNSILVVASRPELLRTASMWITNCYDGSSVASTGVKVYRVKYGDAKQIAQLLGKMFGGNSSPNLDSTSNQIAPGAGTTTLSAVDRLTGGGQRPDSATESGRTQLAGAAQGADASNVGALTGKSLGAASGAGGAPRRSHHARCRKQFGAHLCERRKLWIIERALNQLDRPKLQVAIDVTIAEVTLNDDLSYGVQFFLHNKYGSVSNSTTAAIRLSAPPPR